MTEKNKEETVFTREELVKLGNDTIEGLEEGVREDGYLIVENNSPDPDSEMMGWFCKAKMMPKSERDVKRASETFEKALDDIWAVAKKVALTGTEDLKKTEEYDFTPHEAEIFDRHIKGIYDYDDYETRYPDSVNSSDICITICEVFNDLLAFELMDQKEMNDFTDVYVGQLAQDIYVAQNALSYEPFDIRWEYSYPSVEETAKSLMEQSQQGSIEYELLYWEGEGLETVGDWKKVVRPVRKANESELEAFIAKVHKQLAEVPTLTEQLVYMDDMREGKGLDFEIDYFTKRLGYDKAVNYIERVKSVLTTLWFAKEFGEK